MARTKTSKAVKRSLSHKPEHEFLIWNPATGHLYMNHELQVARNGALYQYTIPVEPPLKPIRKPAKRSSKRRKSARGGGLISAARALKQAMKG